MCLFLSKWTTVPSKMEEVQCIQLALASTAHMVGHVVSIPVIREISFMCPLCQHGLLDDSLACSNWPIQFCLRGCLFPLPWWRIFAGHYDVMWRSPQCVTLPTLLSMCLCPELFETDHSTFLFPSPSSAKTFPVSHYSIYVLSLGSSSAHTK